MQKNVHMVPDDGFVHFYTSAFLFQLLAISYFRKKKKTNQQQELKKKNKNWSNFLFWDSALFISYLTIPQVVFLSSCLLSLFECVT